MTATKSRAERNKYQAQGRLGSKDLQAVEVTRLLLPIKLSNGNSGRTTHFGASAKRRKKYEQIIRLKYGQQQPLDKKQRVTVTRLLGKGERLFDHDSTLRGNAKELIDAMTACGWWHDDSPKWLTAVDGRQDDSNREYGPATLIEIEVI